MTQAENWEAIQPHVAKLRKAIEELPSPPHPDDDYSQKRNDLNKTLEGIEEQVSGRVQMEQMDDV